MIKKKLKDRWRALSALAGKKNSYQYSVDSIFFDRPIGRQPAPPGSHVHMGTSFTKKNFVFFSLAFLMVFSVIFFRLGFLQIGRGEDYLARARANREKRVPIMSERGQILDRWGRQLTDNIPNFSLVLRPTELPREERALAGLVAKLSELTQSEAGNIESIIREYASYPYNSITILDNLYYEQALSVQIKAADLPGIYIERSSKRLYNLTGVQSLSHVIGYLGKLNGEELKNLYPLGYLPSDNIGRTGVEAVYEKVLRGKSGEIIYEVNAFGREQVILSQTEPLAGEHVKLTIDLEAQKKLESILATQLKISGKTKGAALALDPRNGEILAMVSLPAFDNNDFSGGISLEKYNHYIQNSDQPLFNRAVSGSYPSGSTIKPAIAAAALEEGIIKKDTSILSTGGISIAPWFFPDWLPDGHGATNVRYSLAWSVNTFYYYIGGGYRDFIGLGIDKISEYLKKFGLGVYLKIDLSAENAGFLPSREWKESNRQENWYIGDTYNVSIGQGDVLVTPLQIAVLTATIANGGTLYQPRILKARVDPTTLTEKNSESKILGRGFISQDNLETVRLGMKDCVDYGSCRRLSSLPIATAGKTGTAQWAKNYAPHAWYTSFAPFNNPSIVLTVLVEEGESGFATALPVAEEFYKWWGSQRGPSRVTSNE